jgi:hypothetical protein
MWLKHLDLAKKLIGDVYTSEAKRNIDLAKENRGITVMSHSECPETNASGNNSNGGI